MNYNDILSLPITEVFKPNSLNPALQTNPKPFFKVLPSLLSGNYSPANIFTFNSPFINKEAEEVFCDLILYSFLHHYQKLNNNYDQLFKNYSFNTQDVAKSIQEIKQLCIPEFTQYIETAQPHQKTSVFTSLKVEFEEKNGFISEDNPQTFLLKYIQKNCHMDDDSGKQYFNPTCKVLNSFKNFSNPEVQRKSHLFFKSIDDNLLLVMSLLNRIKTKESLNQYISQQSMENYFDFSYKAFKENINDLQTAFINLLPNMFNSSKQNNETIVNYLTSYRGSSLRETSILNVYKLMDKDLQLQVWNHYNFQNNLYQDLRDGDLYLLDALGQSFKNNEVISENNYIKIINNRNPLEVQLQENEGSVSFRINNIDYIAAFLTHYKSDPLTLNGDNEEILQTVNNLTIAISKYLLDNNHIDEFSKSTHYSHKDFTKTGFSYTFSNNGQLNNEQFLIFVQKIATFYENLANQVGTQYIDSFGSISTSQQANLFRQLNIYYQEALLNSDLDNIPVNTSTVRVHKF